MRGSVYVATSPYGGPAVEQAVAPYSETGSRVLAQLRIFGHGGS
ncbi:MAG: hypothetical protein BMS9Abin07_1128 [Acidimicrobiia bacterium]|nr:MAG: hypothetical protein BMS9Abin07_1128 [Acidimicrobiia bacterium]